MSTPTKIAYPFPAELGRIARDRSAVIEASAGTGKTFLIEHLVVDRLLRGDAKLEEMLVVTFTDRAASELRRRIGALIKKVATTSESAGNNATSVWTIDDEARARLATAARAIDGAPISTIHAFCQRVLTEQAFASGRLLLQQSVESRAAFAAAFAEVLRQELAVDNQQAPYLEAYLARGGGSGTVDSLEAHLFRAHQLRARWGTLFDPERIAAAARAFARLNAAELEVTTTGMHAQTAKAVNTRLRTLHAAAHRFDGDQNIARFLSALDEGKDDLLAFVTERLERRAGPVVAAVAELADAAIPLDAAVAQLFLPAVAARLKARKKAAGLYDFDDMLTLVNEALAGPRGTDLTATLRQRYRLAVVDEFQDTDQIQWEIFRTIFDDRAQRPLYLVGDPKQAIYGFRGADVATYVEARHTVMATDEAHHLTKNFRSTRAVIDAYNAILDQTAPEPFFNQGDVSYDPPVTYGPDDGASPTLEPTAAAAITLLRVTADEDVARLPMRAVREGLAQAVSGEIVDLLAAAEPLRGSDIFVLTRTWAEAKAVAGALGSRGVPAVIYNQEGLYASPEARQVRDLLRAVADPRDPAKRLRAWLTPFFGLSLGDLPAAAAAEGDHPLFARLFGWHAAAAREPLGRLYARILDESGVISRELFTGESARRLVNIRHLFEVLSAEAARAARPLGDVVRRLSALCEKLLVPEAEEGNVQRLESDRDAVQIMTMHKAKGLEAEVVFLYGGYSPSPNRGVRHYTDAGSRVATAGRPRTRGLVELIKRERESEDQRLFYVALTRARRRLYLPFSGEGESDAPIEGGTREINWKLSGGYSHVNRRLRALRADEAQRRHFEVRDVRIDPRGSGDGGRSRVALLGLVGWRPEGPHRPDGPKNDKKSAAKTGAATVPTGAELAELRRHRGGPTLTSYSRIKQSEGGYRPPTEIHDETDDAPPLADDDLPGGARAGVFVHDLLERVPLESLRASAGFEAWVARDEIRALLEATLRRHGRDPRHLLAAARLAHAALTTPLPVVGGVLPGLAHAEREAREMEFLFPFPEAAGGADRGYVKGFVDLLFEHQGRVYFGDWKTDRLPSWDQAVVEAHVAKNYALQEQLYALALVRMLGIASEAEYEARFGGTLYLFVRGLPGAVRSRRPSFAELTAWGDEIAGRLGAEETS
jgi:exodeoxyribonuclease V beta subunit